MEEKKIQSEPKKIQSSNDTIKTLTEEELEKAIQENNHPTAKKGRPKFIIDYDLVERLGKIMCTYDEVASVLGCSKDVVVKDKKAQERLNKGKEQGKACLRRIQWEQAKHNPSMAIWLGKQYLGQRDSVETVENKENIQIVNDVPKAKQG